MSPYKKSNKRSWWNVAVANSTPETVQDLYFKKFDINGESIIATAGSCFAQHIARNMRERGYRIFDGEPPPFGLSAQSAREFGYGIYSCRYGNIYHVRQLRQLVREALSGKRRDGIAWEHKGRYYDALRPSVEPQGLDTEDEVYGHREQHLKAVARMLRRSNVLIFTLGLTEAWVNTDSGVVYPVFPGAYGKYDPEKHELRNFRVSDIIADFNEVRRLVHTVNPKMKFILTVSPVPLIATATSSHVLVATTASKSILRAAAQQLYDEHSDVDYFPSYEIISSPWSQGRFFEAGLRNVTVEGVNTVMRTFFMQHPALDQAKDVNSVGDDEIVCDEVILEAFQS